MRVDNEAARFVQYSCFESRLETNNRFCEQKVIILSYFTPESMHTFFRETCSRLNILINILVNQSFVIAELSTNLFLKKRAKLLDRFQNSKVMLGSFLEGFFEDEKLDFCILFSLVDVSHLSLLDFGFHFVHHVLVSLSEILTL